MHERYVYDSACTVYMYCIYVCMYVYCIYVHTYICTYVCKPVRGDEIMKLLKFIFVLGGALATVCIDVHSFSMYCTCSIASTSGWFALQCH